MPAERLVQQGGLDDRRGGAPAVDRVRVVGRVADGEEARSERTLAVDEAPQPVAEVSHHQDGCRRAVDRHRDAPRAPGRDGGKRPHERLEAGGIREAPERAVGDRRADADRERCVVTREDRDLDPPEVARDETGRTAWRPSMAPAVEARVVERAGIRRELERQRGAARRQPGGGPRPSTGGVDHQRGAHHAAVGQANTRDRGTSPVARRDREAGDRDTLVQLDPGPRAHALAEHPFERRAPAGEEDHLVVALLGSEGHAGRRERGETELADTQRAQPVEHLGQVGEEHEPQPREERVRVAELRNAAALPASVRGLGLGHVGPRVPLEHDDTRVVPREEPRRRETRDAAAEDDGGRVVRRPGHRPSIAVGVRSRQARTLARRLVRGPRWPIAHCLGRLERVPTRMQAKVLEGRDRFVGGSQRRHDFVDGRRKRRPLVLLLGLPEGDRGAE